MIGRINYSKRHKIFHDDIKIALHKDDEGMWFSCDLDLERYDFEPDSKVSVTAGFKGLKERFDFGTIAEMRILNKNRITKIHGTNIVHFSVKVTGEKGLIRGTSSEVSLGVGEKQKEKIPMFYVNLQDLGDQSWKIDFDSSDSGRPLLVINKRIPDLYTRATTDINMMFHVYPFAFRTALLELVRKGEAEEDQDDWTTQWKTFIVEELGITKTPDFDLDDGNMTTEQMDWIDDCVDEFCKRNKLFEKFLKSPS